MGKTLAPITPRIPGQATPFELDRFVDGHDRPAPRLDDEPLAPPVGEAADPSVAPSTDHLVATAPPLPAASSPRRPASKAPKKGGRALFARADGSARRKVSFYFEPELAKQLHLHCIAHDRDMSTFVADLVRRALTRHA